MLRARESERYGRTLEHSLYLETITGRGPGPRRHGGAVVAIVFKAIRRPKAPDPLFTF
jgi:hypothetical protein